MLIIKTYEEKKEEIRLQEINTQIAEAKQYLVDTDHKFYGDYELKSDETPEDLENIRVQRSIARTFIRENEDV